MEDVQAGRLLSGVLDSARFYHVGFDKQGIGLNITIDDGEDEKRIRLIIPRPQAVPSWREHYYSITPVFFALNILYIVSLPAVNWFTGGVVFSPVENSLLALGAVLSVGGMISRNPRLHWIVLLVFLVVNTATVLFLAFAPVGTPS